MRKIKVKKKEEPVLIEENDTMSVKSIVIMLIIMGIVFVGFYFITVKVTERQNSNNNKTNETVVEDEYQTEKILFGQMLTRKENEYYVYAYDEKSKLYELFEKYIKDYNEKDDKLTIYRIDLNAGMNKEYVSDKTVVNDSLDGLQVSGITLFKIKDGKIDSYYTTSKDIANALK